MNDSAKSDGQGAKRKKLVPMIGAVVLLVAVGAAGLWFGGVLKHRPSHGAQSAATAILEKPVLVDLPDIISNLDTGGRRASFIKLHVKLQVAHASDVPLLVGDTPKILDIFQTYLRSTRPEELKGGQGTYRLREALMSRIDDTIAPIEVTDLLFTELLVQ